MIVQLLNNAPRFEKDESGEIVLRTRLAIALSAETSDEEAYLQKFIAEKV